MRYILMNKDEPWALFSCIQDEFGEESAVLNEWYTELRPLGLQSLTAWLEKRKAPKHRKHIEQLLEQYGCIGLEGFLRVTHALSLNDTFWVKEESETLGWDKVSLYRNEFDALIAQAAFSGVISVESLSSTSPEFGTDGYYANAGCVRLTAFICTRAAVIPMRLSRCPSFLRVSLRSRFVHRLCITIWGSIIKN